MYRVFILDDQPSKVEDIMRVINDCLGKENVEFDNGKFINAGLSMVRKGQYDLLIIDDTMPRFTDRPNDLEGHIAEEVLYFLELRGSTVPCIVCSSNNDKEYAESLMKDFKDTLLGYVRYDIASIDWEKDMKRFVREALNVA